MFGILTWTCHAEKRGSRHNGIWGFTHLKNESKDKALIRNLYLFKKYSLRRILAEFLKINCDRERVGMLLTEIWETCSPDQMHETSRLKLTRRPTEENVITVNEMVGLLNHKAQKLSLIHI